MAIYGQTTNFILNGPFSGGGKNPKIWYTRVNGFSVFQRILICNESFAMLPIQRFSFFGDDDEDDDKQIVHGAIDSCADNEAVSSAIRVATEGLALLDDDDTLSVSLRTHMTRIDRIRQKRGAFKWLPVYCSNDIQHGSWFAIDRNNYCV